MPNPVIGDVGLWVAQFDFLQAEQVREVAKKIEQFGYKSMWIPEVMGRESFTSAALLLQATSSLVVATGITNIWGRDPLTMSAAHKTLSEAYPGRFILGLGVSHAPLVEGLRGHSYQKPLSAMRSYLEAMDAAPCLAPPPSTPPVRMLGALGPKMLALAAEKTAGAHPYLVTPAHTRAARDVLGEGSLLVPEQKVLLETDPTSARRIARAGIAPYLGLPNYARNLLRLGFSEDDLAGNGSDRLVDALVAWGTPDTIAKRTQEHIDAGADSVCLQVLSTGGSGINAVPLREWELLAGILPV